MRHTHGMPPHNPSISPDRNPGSAIWSFEKLLVSDQQIQLSGRGSLDKDLESLAIIIELSESGEKRLMGWIVKI